MISFVKRNEQVLTEEAYQAFAPMDRSLAALLYARGVNNAREADRFLHPSLDQLFDPYLMSGMKEAAQLLADARAKGQRVTVYGDYDVDGICATVIMVLALRRFGLDVQYQVPLREEGYGLNEAAVRSIAKDSGLLLTVDLGVSNVSEVALAKALGLRVIVSDHHQLPENHCRADALVHPQLSDYPCPMLCGAGVALKMAQALLGQDAAKEYIDLAALATVADIVPLLSENRVIVAKGLETLTLGQRPGVAALKAVSGLEGELNAGHIGFQLAPRLNAAGRLKDARLGIELLLSENASDAAGVAKLLDEANSERKKIEQRALMEALEQAKEYDFITNPVLIVRGADWHPGVIGLVAGRLCQQYACPVMALCEDGDELHGSLRSVKGVHIQKMLTLCDDLLVRYGGHEMAAGVTVAKENAEAFFDKLCRVVGENAAPDAFAPKQEYDVALSLSDITKPLSEQLKLLAPFGMGNPAPTFLSAGISVERRRACGAAGAHLQLTLREGGAALDGIAFGQGALLDKLTDGVDCVYAIKENEFMGRVTLQMEVKALRPAAGQQQGLVARMTDEDFALSLLDALEHAPKGHFQTSTGITAGKTAKNSEVILNTEGAIPTVSRGTLFVARTRETALRFLKDCASPVDLFTGEATDPRCLPALLLRPELGKPQKHWRRIVLLDGEAFAGEMDAWLSQCPGACVTAGGASEALRVLADTICLSDDAARALYRLIRSRTFLRMDELLAQSGLSLPRVLCALTAFSELSLAEYALSPLSIRLLPARKCALSDSPTLSRLRALANGKEAF